MKSQSVRVSHVRAASRSIALWLSVACLNPVVPLAAGQTGDETPHLGAHQASGLIRRGDELLIVDDESPGGFFRYPLSADSVTRIEPSALAWVELAHATRWPSISRGSRGCAMAERSYSQRDCEC